MLKGSIVQQLDAAHRTGKRPIRFGVYYKNTLVALCHALEDWILNSASSPIVIAAFQRGKWYLQEADRYNDLAKKSRNVVIMAAAESGFGEHPTSQMPNVDLVSLDPSDPVAQEWHLMILSPTYTAVVLCQELSEEDYGPAGFPQEDRDRKFYGLWTFEPELVKETVELAIEHIGRYNPELAQALTAQVQAITEEAVAQERDDLSEIVSRVVEYLQTSQLELTGSIPDAHSFSSQQALDRNLVSNEIQAFLRMAQLMDLADTTNPMAAAEVVALAEMLGQLLDLPAWQMKRLHLAALLHRLEPLQGVESVLSSGSSSGGEEHGPCCPLVQGAQVLRRMPQLRAVARILTHEAEWWNGTGLPGGMAGEEIPLESRILALAADFQQRVALHRANQPDDGSGGNYAAQALAECQAQQGERWDPKLVDTLALLVMGLQQGLTLPVSAPNMTAGMWLLDFRVDSEAKAGETTSTYSSGGRYES
ncbi:DICT sensory domain-containing protein [Microcoleus sp. FACHB-68]|uniref:DICT sensory domain-containing protein n=1 Tax=Microcoleus sp. FACHB-68 TaxID=2692826 RepID=UPI00168474DF|nr:DICT sensory domain-containing protein [Microcoleus sp. FACHB-68]MBD1938035.1 metal-dependent phosphohydrolase [Microcoleus sp. FACHB-68]